MGTLDELCQFEYGNQFMPKSIDWNRNKTNDWNPNKINDKMFTLHTDPVAAADQLAQFMMTHFSYFHWQSSLRADTSEWAKIKGRAFRFL